MLRHPDTLRYSVEHQWIDSSSPARVGITDFAQHSLGTVVYVGLPRVGDQVTAGQVVGDVESAKSVSDICAPSTGVVVAVNPALESDPGILNTDPYEAGWLFTIDVTEDGPLLTAAEYETSGVTA